MYFKILIKILGFSDEKNKLRNFFSVFQGFPDNQINFKFNTKKVLFFNGSLDFLHIKFLYRQKECYGPRTDIKK